MILTKANESLESLDISENKKFKKEFYELISNKYISNPYSNLNTLRLGGNQIGDEIASLLCEKLLYASPIRVLDLSNNLIGNKTAFLIADVISADKNLIALYLNWNKITQKGATEIINAFNTNTRIQIFSIAMNPIGNMRSHDKSSMRLANSFKEMFQNNKNLVHVDLSYCDISK